MLVGPGDLGKYFDNSEAYSKESGVKMFAEEVKINDVVILKRTVRNIIAAGTIEKDKYCQRGVFGDVQGFSLQHLRYVTWHKPDTEIPIRRKRTILFEIFPLQNL